MKTLLTLLLLCIASAEACTGLQLKSSDGSFVNGRTLEFGRLIDVSIAVIPRNYQFAGYKTNYAAVGVITFDEPALMDGVNEKGLAVGAFYFPGYASYSKENPGLQLSASEFPSWILSQFSTVEEVKAALPKVAIAPTPVKGWGPDAPPLHYIVYDKSGKSIVIEPLNQTLVVHENPIGVLTNSPTFDWHLTNLRNYIGLSPTSLAPIKLDGLSLASFGQGSGLIGLPGDFTPPSRFVRATVFASTAIPSATSPESVLQLFHILNQFDIPVGAAREVEGGVTYSDYTQFTAVRDPQTLKYYFRTYNNQAIREVDLSSFDLNASEIRKLADTSTQTILNVSKELK